MITRPDRIPLRPDYSAARYSVPKAVFCLGRNIVAKRGDGAESYGRTFYPRDEAVRQLLTRDAVSPTTTSADLVPQAVADLTFGSENVGAFADLGRRSLTLEPGRAGSVMMPSITPSDDDIGFVPEAGVIPFRQLLINGALLTLRKFAVAFALSRETFEHSAINGERLIRAVMLESIARKQDVAAFSDVAGDDTRPPGIWNGVAPTAPTASMVGDLIAVTSAIAPVAGNQIALIVNPVTALKFAALLPQALPFPVLQSSAVADDMLVAVAVNAFAVGLEPDIRLEVSEETAVHSDTSPAAISTEGTPNVVAAPVRSLWQTDCIGVRVILRLGWALRAEGAVAHLTYNAW